MAHLSQEVIAAAQAAQRVTKVWTSVQLAQYGLESAWGSKVTGTNNFFGIKAIPGQSSTPKITHEDIHGRYVEITASFANYPTLEAAFLAHSLLLASHPAYALARATKTAEAFAEALTGHYATDPDYGNKLIQIMRESKLEQYDT